MVLYGSLALGIYIALILRIRFRLQDIAKHPRKYDEIRGLKRYRKSLWYERKVKRYGPGYYATVLIGIPFLVLMLQGYYYLKRLFCICFPALIQGEVGSTFFYLGCIAFVFYSIALFLFLLYMCNGSMFVAARLYAVPEEEWIYKGSFHLAWRNMYRWLLVCTILCFPLLAVGLVF